MPFKSQAQRRKFYAMKARGEISPETVKEWEDATPKGKKLPYHVKKSYDAGAAAALARFGVKLAGEELRLKIPERRFHGFDAAVKSESERGHKRADCGEPHGYGDRRSSEALADMLMSLDDPPRDPHAPPPRDPLDRSTMWGPPSNLAAGDTAGRLSDMGQTTGFGGI